jgi:hypothetical protein
MCRRYVRSIHIFMASIFIGPALLELASQQAALNCRNDGTCDESNDDPKIYGFKPSSLLTNLGTVANLVSTFCLPLAGVMVDYAPWRRHVGMYTAAGISSI